MLINVRSSYIAKIIFTYNEEEIKLKLIKYNKALQKKIDVNIINYKLFKGRYIIYESNGKGKEYNSNDDKLIYEGEYLKGQRNGKGWEYYQNGIIKFFGEYLKGKRNGKGKEYNIYGGLKFDGEYLNNRKIIGIEYDFKGNILYKLNSNNNKETIKEEDINGNIIFKGEYLTKDEIKKETDNFMLEIFQKNKNIEGNLSKIDFNRITNGLIDNSIINIIFQICSSKNDRLSKNDFKYFYALLKTKNFDAKINFLLYFIFEKNVVIGVQNYLYLVKKYYEKSPALYGIFLNSNIINNEIIEKKNVFEFIKINFKPQIENFIFNKEISIYSNIDIAEENIINNNLQILSLSKNFCNCLSKKNNSIYFSTDFYGLNASLINQYDSLKPKFEEYKSKNNGIFPISLLRKMLKEIHIIPSLIDLITNYIEKKTQKGLCTFELFKEFLTILTIDLEGQESDNNKKIFKEGLFLLFSYPNDYIDKTSFCSFIQLTKNNFSLNSINDILNQYKIPKKINMDKFGEIIDYLISELSPSLEKIKYIPYIFFDSVIINKKIEINCIIILLNGKKLNEYILEEAKSQNKFYIINYDFWEAWEKNINLQNYDELKNLKINTEKLCDKNGQMKEGLVYFVNYIILTERIYKIFCNCYGKPQIEIERDKIIIDTEENNETYYQNIYSKDYNILMGEDSQTKKKFEIEINPVFLLFLLYQDLPNIVGNSFNNLKEEIKKRLEDNTTRFTKCSRKTKFSKVLLFLQEKTKMELDENNSRLWIYYHERFEIISMIP